MHSKKKKQYSVNKALYKVVLSNDGRRQMGVLGIQQGVNPQASNVGPLDMNALPVYTIT